MDCFNGLTNSDFIEYYSTDLNSLYELTQYIYPHELQEDSDVVGNHITRCQGILFNYIQNSIDLKYCDVDDIELVLNKKKIELLKLLQSINDEYCENVKINYIQFK